MDCFAAFMGVAFRESVAAGADVVLTAPTLAPVLSLAAGAEERETANHEGSVGGHDGTPAGRAWLAPL